MKIRPSLSLAEQVSNALMSTSHYTALTQPGGLVLAGYTAFFWYLSTAHKGPWTTKFDIPNSVRDAYKDFGPEFASKFAPDSHPGMRAKQNN